MKVSVGLPTGMEGMMYPVPFAGVHDLVDVAKRAEALGYDSVWGNDHMTTQRYVREEFDQAPNFWEILSTYAYIAAETTKLRMGTGMLVLPMRRDIVVAAKQIATIDHLSRGRLEIGIGIGAYREEFEALHPDWKVHRGRMVEEAFQALDLLYNQRVSSFDGEFYKFDDIEMYPKTFQPVLPTYVGGNNVNALQRTADYATGWLPACLQVDKLRQNVDKLHALVEARGRDPRHIEVAPQYVVYVGKTREEAVRRFKDSQMHKHLVSLSQSTLKDQGEVRHEDINLIGDPAWVIEKAQALKAAGATHLLGLYFAVNTLPELYEQMEIFAKEVVPHI